MLGRTTPPVYAHHPLVMNPAGVKLSKSNRDSGVRELRTAGCTPADVIGRAAAAAGLASPGDGLDARDVARFFG
jgi:glutamyl/glutaminyl-tRNA synthetase